MKPSRGSSLASMEMRTAWVWLFRGDEDGLGLAFWWIFFGVNGDEDGVGLAFSWR